MISISSQPIDGICYSFLLESWFSEIFLVWSSSLTSVAIPFLKLLIPLATSPIRLEIFPLPKSKTTKITTIAEILSEESGVQFEYDVIGKFPGEKLHEILITEEELDRTQDNDHFFSINPYWGEGGLNDQTVEYSSNEEIVEDKEVIKSLIAKADLRSKEVETDSGTYSKL